MDSWLPGRFILEALGGAWKERESDTGQILRYDAVADDLDDSCT